jgi:tripartite ATP-independent transporter DctM subunit
MDWWLVLSILFVAFMLLLLTGMPVAFCFGILNTAAVLVFFHGGPAALSTIAHSTYYSISGFAFVAVPLFILMGATMMHSGLVTIAISEGIDLWIGRVPGRLALVGTATAALFGAASGSSMASSATIGQTLVPEMLNRGYARWLAVGSIAASGGIAILIPPSSLMIIFAGIASLPVGKLLIAGIVPGLMIAFFLSAFVVIIAWLKPEIAPPVQEARLISFRRRLRGLRQLLPIVALIVIVIGSIFFGIASPSESAAMGALGSFLLAAAYRKLTLEVIKRALFSTVSISGMALLIVTTSKVFSQVLAYTGSTAGLTACITKLQIGPLTVLLAMNLIVFIMGCLMDPISIMLITIPIFLPIAKAMGMDILWWAMIMMVNIEIGLETPPFGMNLYVIRGVTPGEPSMMSIYRAILPFVLIELTAMGTMILFPGLITWLPGLMS